MEIPKGIIDATGLMANVLSICTPIVLLIWFLVTSKRQLSGQYFAEIPGSYGGFTEPINPQGPAPYAGILLRVLNVDANGYFQGEFDFGENLLSVVDDSYLHAEQLREGVFTCMGKIRHSLYYNRDRDPLQAKENRVYYGKFYVVDRLDIDFKSYNIQDYIQLEYDVKHFREMKTIELTLCKKHREVNALPEVITLYKKIGLQYDVYDSVEETSFSRNRTLS